VAPTSAQFSDVNAAVAYAQNSGIPSVSVLAGTYSAVTILGTQTLTIIGPTVSAVADNQVVITSNGATGSLSFGTSNGLGLTLRNLNLTNSAASSGVGPAISAKGVNVGIYTCALISNAQGVYSASYGTALISNSYVQGTDKLFYNYPTVYVYGSTIVPTLTGSSIFYGKGNTIAGTNYNATLVVDSSSVQGSVSNVYLATPNGAAGFINVVYRNTSLGGLIASPGVYSTACTAPGSVFGEFQNNGVGSYANNAAARGSASCDFQMSADQVSSYTLKSVFANAFSGYASADTTWIDFSVLSAIQNSDDAQVSSATVVSGSSSISSASGTASPTCPTPTPSATLVVSINATAACTYGNISAAIGALPNDNQPYIIRIQAGIYQEQISITRNGKVTLVGESDNPTDYSQNVVKVQFSNGQLTSAGKNEQTPVLNVKKTGSSPDFAVYNIDFVNTYPQTPNTAALAADYYGSNFAAYGCSFIGFQDTLLANKGIQVFANSYIEGSIDFIWGFSTSYFYRSVISSNTMGGFISAQGRVAGTVSGYVFDECKVTYKASTYGSNFGTCYLGRPYSSYSTVVYKNSYIDKHINLAGWTVWSTSSPQTSNVVFGEFNNTGPGSWQPGTSRASFATNMTAEQVAPYSLSNWIGDTSFIDQNAWNFPAPFSIDTSSTTGGPASPTATGAGSTATAAINAHPESGTVPPQFAITVSTNGEINGSYSNVTAALASLPKDSTNQTIFIYPGSYNEQLPSINRPGAVRLIGSIDGNPGQSYKDNKVTITFSRGLSVSPLPTGHNDAETAVISTASSRISFYNINMVNTDNMYGSQVSYVTLAASIYGNDIGFYACSFNGWQDTLLNGAIAGYQYYESCYIGGAIDFIWGYSKAYFKGCTIGAKRASSAMTAQSRASGSAIGGYIFDQCLFTAAPDATVDLTNKVYLGRPYSAYALVIVKNSYIDKVINPVGWKVWSATDPRTSAITFAEYNNSGPSNWENNVAARQAFQYAMLLTSDTYSLSSTMDSTDWIDLTYWNSIVTPEPAVVVLTPSNTTVTGNSAYNGTTPPAGALVVSQNPINGQTVYPTIQEALNAAPTSSKTNATIFIYPGTYNEQLIVSKAGTTIFMGYSDATDDYNQNKVTIQQSYGEDTQGTGSDVDAATVYATGNQFYAYNINFKNNNGTQQNIASLGFAVKSSKFAFMHACQIYGNQDTLYISGSMFTFKSLIVGNIDFIFGAGSGYFLNSTIAPNEDGDSITAAKRATPSTAGGFVFDQCSIVPAPGVDASGWKNVSLGRPWNQLANVAYIDSYLDGMIGAAGWDQWSKSSPQTDGVSYGEYHNFGPGSSTCERASFSKQLTDAEVLPYQL
jgi:pectin methylesterase-like acyl-CoA thioesterase